MWDEYVKKNGVVMADRGPFETARKALPDPVPESDNFPPAYGIERIPYKKFMELLSQGK